MRLHKKTNVCKREETVLIKKIDGNVVTLTLNRPKQANALNKELFTRLKEGLDVLQWDDQVRVVIIAASGDKAFCAGAQLSGGANLDGQDVFAEYAGLLNKLVSFPKPTVARIKGYCLAGGMGFMLACDVVIASDDSKFGTPEVNVGLWPMMIGALIFRNVLRKKAMEMILLGEQMTAREALAMGLITRAVPAANLDEEVAKVLKSLASKSPIGMKIGKQAFYEAADLSLKEALNYLSEKLKKVAMTEDAKEGIMAFMEKRQPNFTGK